MPGLPLSTRRSFARGLNKRTIAKPRYGAALAANGLGNRATLTTSLSGTNNDIFFYAKTPGTAGNSVTVALVVSGANTPLTVDVSGTAITVNVATNGSSAATSTAANVINAVLTDTEARDLVWAQVAPQNDGTGVVAALGTTALSGAS